MTRELRDLTRYRKTLIRNRASEANRLHKVLEDAGVKLSSVASNVLGVSGRLMLEALCQGTNDPAALAELGRGRLRSKLPALRRALESHFRDHHAFLVAQILAHLDYLDEAIDACSARIEEQIAPFASALTLLKFALLEAAVKLRKRAWQGRELPLEPETWSMFASADLEPDAEAEQSELLATLQEAIAEVLTPHQRRVLVALALNGVPIDVLAERLNTTRGALYKTLHDARRKLRTHLLNCGLSLESWMEGAN